MNLGDVNKVWEIKALKKKPREEEARNVAMCLSQECEELMSKGITGTGQGFDVPGKRLGGFSRQPPLSSLRATAAKAAEKRVRAGNLLPSGPHRLGGDCIIMSDLTPVPGCCNGC